MQHDLISLVQLTIIFAGFKPTVIIIIYIMYAGFATGFELFQVRNLITDDTVCVHCTAEFVSVSPSSIQQAKETSGLLL